MFADEQTARRIERAEAEVMHGMLRALVGTQRAPASFVRSIGQGYATYVRAQSPLNKVIGVGIGGPLDERALAQVESAYAALQEPVRVEICTLASPAAFEQLGARGYRLQGFENVLCCPLEHAHSVHGEVELVDEANLSRFRETLVEGSCAPDDTGVVLDQFTRGMVETAIDDMRAAPDVARYLAYRDGALAGAANLSMHEDIAVLTGSATLPAHRRRGVQAALLARRLQDARARGAKLAIITTAPGTQSQANVMKQGFSLVHARAVMVKTGNEPQ